MVSKVSDIFHSFPDYDLQTPKIQQGNMQVRNLPTLQQQTCLFRHNCIDGNFEKGLEKTCSIDISLGKRPRFKKLCDPEKNCLSV